MAIDPKDLGELQKALNDAAGKASVLWTTFVIFQLYLAITFGSVTHRDLFLETSLKLPVLNVDLALVGFFAVAPALLVIFHFYLFLQLLGLAFKARDYNTLLVGEAPVASDRRYLRQRLDVFPILQFLAGAKTQRTGFYGFSLRLLAWITLVGTPVLILLQGQVTFLPYHLEWMAWLQRVAVLIDLAVIWYFWTRLRSEDVPILIGRVSRKVWRFLGGVVSLCVITFSVYLATFPGEWVKTNLPRSSLQALLFEGDVNHVSGRPQSIFSNRLVLTDQKLVDSEKLDKITVSHSVRGRDLRLAVMASADLRKVDFFGADMRGASLMWAQLQGASLIASQLQGANLTWAQLQGASLIASQLQGASLAGAQLQGANLTATYLQGATLNEAQLQGAELNVVRLQGATLNEAQLQGASLTRAQLQGASLAGAQLQGASLYRAQLQDTRGTPGDIDLTDLREIDVITRLSEEELEKIANTIPRPQRDSFLRQLTTAKDALDPKFWDNARSSLLLDEKIGRKRAVFLANLACSEPDVLYIAAPHLARGLLHILIIDKDDTESLDVSARQLFADRLRKGKSDPAACPGVKGFTEEDWSNLSKLSTD